MCSRLRHEKYRLVAGKLGSKLNIFRNIYRVLMIEKHLTLENKENKKPTGN